MRFRTLLCSLMVLGLAATFAQAANLHLSIDYAGSFNGEFESLPGSPPAPLFAQSAPHSGSPAAVHVPGAYHQFDVYMEITGLAEGDDFQFLAFDVNLGPGVSTSDVGWTPNLPTYDPTGPSTSAPVFSDSSDPGDDLKAITIIANSANNFSGTHFRHPGEDEPASGGGTNTPLAPPMYLGSVYVQWDGTFGGDNKTWVAVAANPNITDPWNSVTGPSTITTHFVNEMSFGPRSEWVSVLDENTPPVADEPNHIAGVNSNDPGLVPYQFTATDAEQAANELTWDQLAFVDYAPNYGADAGDIPNGNAQASGANISLTPEGLFNWISTGAPRGLYTWSVRVGDGEGGFDTTLLTVDVTAVPEPATIAMVGLALLGFVGFRRGR